MEDIAGVEEFSVITEPLEAQNSIEHDRYWSLDYYERSLLKGYFPYEFSENSFKNHWSSPKTNMEQYTLKTLKDSKYLGLQFYVFTNNGFSDLHYIPGSKDSSDCMITIYYNIFEVDKINEKLHDYHSREEIEEMFDLYFSVVGELSNSNLPQLQCYSGDKAYLGVELAMSKLIDQDVYKVQVISKCLNRKTDPMFFSMDDIYLIFDCFGKYEHHFYSPNK